MPPLPPSRAAAERRYAGLRSAALGQASDVFAHSIAPIPARLSTINNTTLDAWRQHWAGHPVRAVAWPWDVMVPDYRRHHPSRFELAIWSGDTLCGLAIGRTGNAYCSIEYLEGSPMAGHSLKGQVIPAALTALLAYAAVLGKGEMRLMEPFAPLVPAYEVYGFLLVEPRGERPYCLRKTP